MGEGASGSPWRRRWGGARASRAGLSAPALGRLRLMSASRHRRGSGVFTLLGSQTLDKSVRKPRALCTDSPARHSVRDPEAHLQSQLICLWPVSRLSPRNALPRVGAKLPVPPRRVCKDQPRPPGLQTVVSLPEVRGQRDLLKRETSRTVELRVLPFPR